MLLFEPMPTNSPARIDADHAGLDDVKDRIVEHLAVRARRAVAAQLDLVLGVPLGVVADHGDEGLLFAHRLLLQQHVEDHLPVLHGGADPLGLRPEPRLAVAAPRRFSLPRVDLTALPPEHRAAEARRLADEDAADPFDLATGPLFRARLLTLNAADHHLLMTVHHIAGDGWSIDLLLCELAALYPVFTADRAACKPSPLPEPALQYSLPMNIVVSSTA